MQDKMSQKNSKADKLPDEDGTVLVYGFVQIRDKRTGEVLVNTRS